MRDATTVVQNEADSSVSEATRGGRVMDAEAFDELYHASFARLVGQIYAMCGNFSEAQDCVQEAFIRAWDRRRSLDLDQASGDAPGSGPEGA